MDINSVTRIFDIPYYQLKNYQLSNALVSKYKDSWVQTSTRAYIEKANRLSRGLLHIGVQPGDKIAVISIANRTEWHVADIGILQAGAQSVPIYPNISEEEYEYILNHSGVSRCFVSDEDLFKKVNSLKSRVPHLKEIYSFDAVAGCKSWNEILDLGNDESNQKDVEERKNAIQPDDLATIIYTSGTTGKPKGVMLSHHNIVSNVLACTERIPLKVGDVALSFLPVCHIFERMVIYSYQYRGVSIYFAESIDKIGDNLKEVKPSIMTVAPRLLEKLYDKIYTTGTALHGIKRKLFLWAVALGSQFEPYGANGWWYGMKLALARKLVFHKWKAALGDRLHVMVSGGAALQPRLARIFGAAGIPVMEGYGLTETSPVISVNDERNHGWKIGTVGKIIPGVEVKIADDGEILCKGHNIMLGYYKDPEGTAEVMKGAYFHTGDIGEIDSEGFLKITDRKKEMFKTSGGKYIAPQLIENQMKQSPFIEQIMVVGDGEKMPAALIQPNFEHIKEWAKKRKTALGDSYEAISQNPAVIAKIQEEIDRNNKHFGHWEKVKVFELTPDVWSVEKGHLTPTLKPKRKVIKEKYRALYNKMYGHSS